MQAVAEFMWFGTFGLCPKEGDRLYRFRGMSYIIPGYVAVKILKANSCAGHQIASVRSTESAI